MRKFFMFLIVVSVFSACNDKRRIEHWISLCGSEIELNELSLLSLVYVDDSLLIANAMSPSYKLSPLECRIENGRYVPADF